MNQSLLYDILSISKILTKNIILPYDPDNNMMMVGVEIQIIFTKFSENFFLLGLPVPIAVTTQTKNTAPIKTVKFVRRSCVRCG